MYVYVCEKEKDKEREREIKRHKERKQAPFITPTILFNRVFPNKGFFLLQQYKTNIKYPFMLFIHSPLVVCAHPYLHKIVS